MVFSDAAGRWLEYANLSRREKTARFRRSKVAILVSFFGAMRLREINPTRIEYFQRRRTATVASATVNAEWWILRAILKRFGAWTEVHAQISRPLPVQKESRGRALSAQERQNLLACAERNSRWKRELLPIIVLALHTGLRSGELRGIRLRDIFLDAEPRARLAIRRASTKTAAGERLVMLDKSAVAALRVLLIISHGRGARRPEHFLFPRYIRGGGWDPQRNQGTWTTGWRSLRRAAGLADLRFHDLRHTYITMGAEGGVALDVMMRQVGHINPTQTRDYVHIGESAVSDAVEVIEKRFEQTS
jgi:integrase